MKLSLKCVNGYYTDGAFILCCIYANHLFKDTSCMPSPSKYPKTRYIVVWVASFNLFFHSLVFFLFTLFYKFIYLKISRYMFSLLFRYMFSLLLSLNNILMHNYILQSHALPLCALQS